PLSRKGAGTATDHAPPFEAIQPLGVVSRDMQGDAGTFDPRNDAAAITYEDRIAALHSPQVVAQAVLELGDLDRDHYASTCPHPASSSRPSARATRSAVIGRRVRRARSEEHTSELQSPY